MVKGMLVAVTAVMLVAVTAVMLILTDFQRVVGGEYG